MPRPHFKRPIAPVVLFAVGIMLAVLSIGGNPTQKAEARVASTQDACLGSIHLHGDVFRNGSTVSMDVTSNAAVNCPLLFLVYITHNHASLQEGPQDLVKPFVMSTIHPGENIKLAYPGNANDCALQVDTLMGYTGPVYDPLTKSPQYGTEFLGPNRTFQGGDCNEQVTPTPTPTPVPTATPTPTTVPPTPTATSTKLKTPAPEN